MARGSFETQFPAVCQGCGAYLPAGEPVLAYGRGKLYGRRCHDRTTHDGDAINAGFKEATAEQLADVRAGGKAGAQRRREREAAASVNEGGHNEPTGHAPDIDVVDGY